MFELTPFDRKRGHMEAFNPFKELEEIEKIFFSDNSLAEFKTDIKDTGTAYLLEADLPGFHKEDIHVDIDNSYLTISAERHSEAEEKDHKGNFVRCERSYGSFSRSFDISNVKAEEITASYKNGVLKLNMPKKDTATPTSRRLNIE